MIGNGERSRWCIASPRRVVRELFPDLDFQQVIYPYVQRLVMQRLDFSRAGPEVMALVLGLQTFVNEVPGQLEQLLNDVSTGRFQVGVKGEAVDALAQTGRMAGMRVSLAIVTASFILVGAMTSAQALHDRHIFGLPALPFLALVGALLFGGGLWLTFLFPKGPQKIRLSRVLWWRALRRKRKTRR